MASGRLAGGCERHVLLSGRAGQSRIAGKDYCRAFEDELGQPVSRSLVARGHLPGI